tara:strand:- start:122 stop:1906 length:1785 start_codon:yes stop_codon:yes gene_type:complete
MAIDANAMYQAGFSSKRTGKDIGRERKAEFWEGVAKTTYNVLGNAVLGQVSQNYRALQKSRDASDSQMASVNQKIDKMPKNATALRQSVVELRSLYDKASSKASISIGKKKRGHKQDMAKYMTQLHDLNATLEVYSTNAKRSLDMVSVLNGTVGENNQSGAKTMSSAANAWETSNLLDQGNGDMALNLRWDIKTGQMMVQRGGEWRGGEYVPKEGSTTGTYEEYVQSHDRAKNEAYTKYLDANTENEDAQSRDEWEESNKKSTTLKTEKEFKRGNIHLAKYSDLKFPDASDRTFGNDVSVIGKEISKMAWASDSRDWDSISEDGKKDLQGQINGYTDAQFKDYFFGGDSFDHSNRRMPESSFAYKLLKGRGLEPGTAEWEGELTVLKGQPFVSGSHYRREITESIWKDMETKYKNTQAEYKEKHPIKSSGSGDGTNYIKLPWGGKIPEAVDGTERGKQELAIAIADGQKTIQLGNDEYTLQGNGNYKLTGEIVAGKTSPVESSITKTKSYFLSKAGRFGRGGSAFYGDDEGVESTSQTPVYDPNAKVNPPTEKEMKQVLSESGAPYNVKAMDSATIRKEYNKYIRGLFDRANKK